MKTSMAKSIQDLSSKKQFHWTAKVSNEEEEEYDDVSFNPSSSSDSKESPILKPELGSIREEKKQSGRGVNQELGTIHEEKKQSGGGLNQEPRSIKEEKKQSGGGVNQESRSTQEEKKQSGRGVNHESRSIQGEKKQSGEGVNQVSRSERRKMQAIAVSRLKSMFFSTFGSRNRGGQLGTRLVGTLFGHRRGHVHFAFQKDPTSQPVFLVELATPITGLVREMASGLVRIALECDKDKTAASANAATRLIDEPVWRTYCNGKKCGFATKRECGPKELEILKAVEPISMGAGVLPTGDGESGEIMYMRAKFERVVGSRDSEAFYMMNPDSNGAPELSIYLLRV